MIALNIKFSNKCCLEIKMSRKKNLSRKKNAKKLMETKLLKIV